METDWQSNGHLEEEKQDNWMEESYSDVGKTKRQLLKEDSLGNDGC